VVVRCSIAAIGASSSREPDLCDRAGAGGFNNCLFLACRKKEKEKRGAGPGRSFYARSHCPAASRERPQWRTSWTSCQSLRRKSKRRHHSRYVDEAAHCTAPELVAVISGENLTLTLTRSSLKKRRRLSRRLKPSVQVVASKQFLLSCRRKLSLVPTRRISTHTQPLLEPRDTSYLF